MRKHVLSCLFSLIFLCVLGKNEDSVKVYTYAYGRSSLHVLRLYKNGNYEHLLCTKTTVKLDTGRFKERLFKLTFDSHSKKGGLQSMRNVVFYMRNEKLYEKYWEAIFQAHVLAEKTTDSIYYLSMDFNPLTRKYLHEKSSGSNTAGSVSKDKVYFLGLLNNFAPRYKHFIDSNYCGPGCYLTVVGDERRVPSKDTTDDRLFSSFNTVIHETTHHFNSSSFILVDPEIVIHFRPIKTYQSKEFISLVPEAAKTKIFRFSTYVSPLSKVSSNVSGIAGIMDEFSAYRNGTRASLDAALEAKKQGNEKRTIDFLNEALPTYYAYHEFSVFISWYLEYGAKNKAELHKALMDNTNFRVAFTLLEQGFIEDIKIMEQLVEENPSVKWKYNFYEESAAYSKELLKKQDKILSTFRVLGVTKENYKNYLVDK